MIIHSQMLKENKFSKILHHIKNEEITEKLKLLNEIPTNNTAGIYVIEPESSEVIDTLENIGPNLEKDDQEDGRDTTGLFAPDGTILTDIPPGDNSYILGPMMLIRYTYPSVRYELGYIGNGSRRFTALARINHNSSNFSSWDGNSGFTSYGQLSLEQAQWFRERFLENQVAQYRTFLNGPPPYFPYVFPGPDSYGRFLGWIIGVGRQIGDFIRNRIPPVMGPFDPNLPPGSANPDKKKKKKGELSGPYPDGKLPTKDSAKPRTNKGLEIDTKYHGTDKDAAGKIGKGGFKPTKSGIVPNRVWVGDKNVAGDYSKGGRSSGSMGKNAPNDRTLIPVRTPRGSGVTLPDWGGTQTALPKDVADRGARTGNVEKRGGRRPNPGTRVSTPGLPGGGGSGGGIQPIEPWTPNKDPLKGRKWNSKTGTYGLASSYNPDGRVISESTKSILKNIKKPYVLPEQPKVKYKVKLRANRTVNSNMMKTPEVPPEFKAQPNIWRKGELARNEMMSQQRKNDVLEMTGNSDWFWEHSTETSREKNRNIQYTNFGDKSEKIKGKVVRKEELKGDYLVFIQDQKTNRKKTILQSELNEILAKENAPKEFSQFFEQETIQVDNDPLFKKVSKRLKKEIDYSDKPAKNGYPNDPPPKTINGYHPDLVDGKKVADRFDRLDPESAKAMPPTGNSHIDKKVRASAKKPK